jgi:pyruvate formate lyase activating enzyme
MPEVTLNNILSSHTIEGALYTTMPNGWVRCVACGHRCKIAPGKEGICRVRFNRDGKFFVPSGYVSSVALDPIEKKPFFHAYPGSAALSFGMLGCDYHCAFCQNWDISQTLRDERARSSITEISAQALVDLAVQHYAPIITSTYNEPLITTEWAVEIFKLAKTSGLITSYVSNGNATPEVLDYLQPWIDLYKVDLKSFRQKTYSQVGGVLQTVLDAITSLYNRSTWVEVVTLIIPGINDSDEELKDIANFLVSVSPDIPWHVTAYHEEYKMKTSEKSTPAATLLRAAEIGYNAGLHFVYTGNLPGQTRNYENTYCCSCGELLVERHGFRVARNRIHNGTCFKCHTPIAGRWKIVTQK